MHPMGRSFVLFRAVIVTIAVAACACGSTPTAPETPSPTHTVTGTVTESTSEGLVPVQGALVTHQASGRSATTDAAGMYSIRVPPSMATISVTRDGFEPAIRMVSVFTDTRFDLQLVRRREPVNSHSLSGIIFEKVGSVQTPIAGAVVEDAYSHLSAITGADGRYRIDFSPADLGQFDGFAEIHVRKDGFEPASRWVAIFGENRLDLELVRR